MGKNKTLITVLSIVVIASIAIYIYTINQQPKTIDGKPINEGVQSLDPAESIFTIDGKSLVLGTDVIQNEDYVLDLDADNDGNQDKVIIFEHEENDYVAMIFGVKEGVKQTSKPLLIGKVEITDFSYQLSNGAYTFVINAKDAEQKELKYKLSLVNRELVLNAE